MPRDFFTSAYGLEIAAKWNCFQDTGHVDGVRPVILQSWKRCRRLGVNPWEVHHEVPMETRTAVMDCDDDELVSVASPILERIFANSNSLECLINLANANGVALKLWKTRGKALSVPVGAKLSERNLGTAGMPLCLRNREPVIVFRAEHYCRPHHDMVCVSSPVFDCLGKLLGGITISCHYSFFDIWSLTLVTEAAKSIGEQLRLRSLLARERMLIEYFSDGVLVVDDKGRIIHSNNMARAILATEESKLRHVDDILGNSQLALLIQSGKAFKNEEARLVTAPPGKTARCIISYNPLESGGLLVMKNAPEMYSYAARTAGIKVVYNFTDIVGESRQLRETLQKAQAFADSELTVLILGESGTGKELFAQSIHNASSRQRKPFVVVNCGALPRGLVQSELFGYAEGAFTSARRQGSPGKFELANGGTVFLDEIGEMELEAQASLLRLLQSGEVCRVGGSHWQKVDVRVLAATNRDLRGAVAEGRFRADLYHRLNVCALHVPPLRERTGDIPVLVRLFCHNMAKKYPQCARRRFSEEALALMRGYAWPGNVRELEHFIEKIMFSVQNDIINAVDIQRELPRPAAQPGVAGEKILLADILAKFNGNVASAAKYLGIGKTSLYTKINLLGLKPKEYKKLKCPQADAPGDAL